MIIRHVIIELKVLNYFYQIKIMHRRYLEFVRPTSHVESVNFFQTLSGEEAKKFYLEEIENNQHNVNSNIDITIHNFTSKVKDETQNVEISKLKLFTCVQNDNIHNLRHILDLHPEYINTVDEYGWSLLMIACQANSIETIKELLKRGIDTTIRDKAGNSAQSLVIRNKNVLLANILWNHCHGTKQSEKIFQKPKNKYKEKYICEKCDGKSFYSKHEHLSSTVHNINVSKGKKIPTKYEIPESNKGFQLMLKVGWDRDSGLGSDGSGKRYPIKAVQKRDKTGLGHKKTTKLKSEVKECTKVVNKKQIESDYEKNRRLEINFRREFY